ncbi:hypothetical protein ABIA30_002626 [Mycobacterium sp. MAA66]|uniref:hypothetical protein n=1 Tax=Mycobacterium sp. MAA66 TaxID=3156297 RepID=UPI0035178E2C
MRTKIALVAPWLAIAAAGGAIALAPLASADTDPGVPSGGNTGANSSALHRDPSSFGWHSDDHDETDGSAGGFDVPF